MNGATIGTMNGALVLSAGLAFPGYALLCLAMARHERQVFGRPVLSRRGRALVRLGGWVLLAASAVPPLGLPHPGIGAVAWVGVAMAAPAVLLVGLAYAPRLAVGGGCCATVLPALGWLAARLLA